MSDADPVVRVTLTTIYDKLLDVDKKVDPIPATVADHERRLRNVESRFWAATGAVGLVAFVTPFLVRLIP